MAEVTPYRDQITPELGPNTGTDALISAARRVGPLEREAGLAVQQGVSAIGTAAKDVFAQREAVAARREIAAGFESHALMQGQHEADLNQLLSDPELSKDPARLQQALQGFKANVLDPENEKWVSGFTTQQGQEWAALHAGQQGAELLKHAHSMSDIISANEALTSVSGAVNQLSANAIANPMTIDQQLASFDSGVKGLAGTISDPVKRAEFEEKIRNLRGQIAYAGVHSAIETSPAVGRQLAAKYGSIMTPEHQTAAESYATAITKANQQQARIDRSMQRQDEHDAADAEANKILLSMYDQNGNARVPADFMQNMTRAAAMGRMSPGTFHMLMTEKDAILREQARGTPTVDDPAVYADFAQRAALAPDDPRHLTDAEIVQGRIDGTVSDHTAAMFRERVDVASKDPGLVQDQKALNLFIQENKPPNADAQTNQAYQAFVKDRSDKFWYQRKLGVSADDLTNPSSNKFLGFMSEADKAAAVSAPARQAMPSNTFQKQTSLAVDSATAIAGLVRDNNPEQAKAELRRAGIDTDNVDGGAWCAPLVNKALAAVGLQGTGSGLASSFKAWGFPVDPTNVQRGDVFYEPAEGYTGHVGLLTGNTRVSRGVPQVEVVSSHLQGDPSNPGGIEWRDARPMIFRRAQAPIDQIKPGWVQRNFGWLTGGSHGAAPAAQPSDMNPGELQ